MSQRLCLLSELSESQALAVDAQIDNSEESLVLVRSGERVEAFLNVCPHAGRRLDWAPGKFLMEGGRLICAAHGASFALPGGACVAGPCKGQSLSAVAVRVDGDAVVLD
ncbi:MAG: Rieske (2Fe-2S) protein [Xanthomonadales bacterium]|nr:Rieske (2Fe-2S) protein [Xanthomonadales bacterium]